ncbi:MAG: flagellar protein [Lachnospiraceae bacterium]|nr:flagellar protein [Lachnospiraceae bacterium]
MKILNAQFPSIEQAANEYLEKSQSSEVSKLGTRSFAQVLADKQSDATIPKFSKHAANRLSERNIELSDKVIGRLSAGMQAAGQKGINESLVMVDQLAFIVNVKNQTVITALDGSDKDGGVFTNIDGAVIA